MLRFQNTWLFLASLAVAAGCRGRVEADDLPDDEPGEGEEETTGELELYTTSSQASEDTQYVSMEIGMVEAHIKDPDVADEFGGEWLVLSQSAGHFDIVEDQPEDYLIASGTAPVSVYDEIRVEILGGTYVNSEGDEYTVDPPVGSGKLTIETEFCVSPGETTVIDSQLDAALDGGGSDWAFDLDAAVDDHDSCPIQGMD